MKRLTLTTVLLTAIYCYSCKKATTTDPDPIVTPTPTSTTTYNHDAALIGTWFQDSSQSEGGQVAYTDTSFSPCMLDTMYIDNEQIKSVVTNRTKISGQYYYTKLSSIKSKWSVKNDSLFHYSINTGNMTNHYIYTKSGNSIELKLINSQSYWTKYWYHKL